MELGLHDAELPDVDAVHHGVFDADVHLLHALRPGVAVQQRPGPGQLLPAPASRRRVRRRFGRTLRTADRSISRGTVRSFFCSSSVLVSLLSYQLGGEIFSNYLQSFLYYRTLLKKEEQQVAGRGFSFSTWNTTKSKKFLSGPLVQLVLTRSGKLVSSELRESNLLFMLSNENEASATRTTISLVNRLEASAAPSTADFFESRSEPLIEASSEDASARIHNGNFGVIIAAVTSTFTSYSITVTTYKTTAQLATTSALFCLPYGYAVC